MGGRYPIGSLLLLIEQAAVIISQSSCPFLERIGGAGISGVDSQSRQERTFCGVPTGQLPEERFGFSPLIGGLLGVSVTGELVELDFLKFILLPQPLKTKTNKTRLVVELIKVFIGPPIKSLSTVLFLRKFWMDSSREIANFEIFVNLPI